MNARPAMRKPLAWLLGLLGLGVIAFAATRLLPDRSANGVPAATRVPATPVDPANEGRLVEVRGELRVGVPPRDPQLGVGGETALVLERDVEMLQWFESCDGEACTYERVWAARPIDSDAFRDARQHANPGRFPFESARFPARDVRLGDFGVEVALAARDRAGRAWPVAIDQLPPNLAATFRVADGVLYTSADPERPEVGDVRVAYRIVPAGAARVIAVQHGDALVPPPGPVPPG